MKRRLQSLFRFMRRNRAMTKILSFVLSLILVFYVIPSTIYTKAAELLDGSDEPISEVDASSNSAGSASASQPTGVLFEDVSLREESVKHFHLEDGTYLAAQYNYPVHTKDSSGEWQDIDNVLSESGSEFSNSNARIKFAKKINGSSELFALHDGNTKLTLTLIDARKGVVGEVTNNSDAEADTKLQKMMNLEKLSASVIYRNILDGVDLEYVAYSMNVKENIIVKEKKDSYTYSFEFKLNGLTPTLTENGDIEIREDGSDEIKYLIPAPVVFDANGEHAPSTASAYTLTRENGKKYILTVTVDSAWMNDEQRAFPVTVDPAVKDYNSQIIDTYIDSSSASSNGNSSTTLYVTSTRRSYWKSLAMPTLPLSANISEATIKITTIGQVASGSYVGVYGVTKNWDTSLTWSKYSTYGSGTLESVATDYCIVNGVGEYTFNITKIAKRWYEGDENMAVTQLGLAFATIPGHSANVQFYSNEATAESARPALVITYKDMKGVEPYWSYSSHSAGSSGSGSVNLSNGNLVFAIPTLTATDNIFGFTPTLVYNSALSANSYSQKYTINTGYVYHSTPYGFKLNAQETVVEKSLKDPITGQNVIYYIYTDSDGTEHEFYAVANSVYMDSDGLNMVMTVSENSIEITDDSNTVRKFLKMNYSVSTLTESNWYLSEIKDAGGNKLIFTVNGKYHPTVVSVLLLGASSAIEMLKLIYNSEGVLCAVYNPTSKHSVILRYTINATDTSVVYSNCRYLKSIQYCYGNSSTTESNVISSATSNTMSSNVICYDTTEFKYDSLARLTEVINTNSDTSVKYTWQKYRVSKISEYADSTLGQELSIEYATGYAELRATGNDELLNTDDDILTRYVFDTYGRAINVYSCSADGKKIFGAVSGAYDTQEKSKNSISEKTVLGEISPSLIENGDFQGPTNALSSVTGWTVSSNVRRIAGTTFDAPNNLFLSMSVTESATATASQTVTLGAGDYTFSMQYETSNCENISGKVEFIDTDTSIVLHTENISINESNVSQRNVLSTSFTLSSVTDLELKISFSADGTVSNAASIRVGKAKLEAGDTVSDFTLVNAGGFNTELTPSDYWKANSGTVSLFTDPLTDDDCVIMTANGGTKYVEQNVLTKTALALHPVNDTTYGLQFAVSGYAKADCPLEDKNFYIYVRVTYNYGLGNDTFTVEYPFKFSTATSEWQYVSGTFCLGTTADGKKISEYQYVESIDVGCDYSGQIIGNVYFDNISLVYAGIDKTQKTTYDDGLVTRTDDGLYSTYYEYDENRNVTRVADNRGSLIDYYYNEQFPSLVDHTIEYDFTYNGGLDYPYSADDPDSQIVKTPKFRTNYTYNSYGMTTEVLTYETTTGGEYTSGDSYTKESYTYETGAVSKIFGALLTESNADATIRYFYDTSNGWLLASVNTESYSGYAYTYDATGRLLRVDPAIYSPTSSSYSAHTTYSGVEYEYDTANRLSGISTYSTDYTLSYDIFGNSESISVGDNELASYEYNENNGKLKRIIYGNGYEVEYVYDELEQLTAIKYKANATSPYVTAYEYKYTSDGLTHSVKDNINSRVTVYRYDENNRLAGVSEYSSDEYESIISTVIGYDDKSRISSLNNHISYSYTNNGNTIKATDTIERTYSYLDDSKLSEYSISGNFTSSATYIYDSLDRVSEVVYTNSINGNNLTISESYTYSTDNNYGESTRVKIYTSAVGTSSQSYTYTYDDNGYITNIRYSSGKTIEYTYNDLGWLIKEDNDITYKIYTYSYNNAGNIVRITETEKTQDDGFIQMGVVGDSSAETLARLPALPVPGAVSYVYTYTDSEWGDLLTSFNGTAITYDEIGNPLSYYNGSSYTFGWEGRELIGATKGGVNYAYAYNSDGLRIRKTKNVGTADEITTHFVYDGDILVAEYTDSETIVYIYDAYDNPIGFKYRSSSYTSDTWDVYWYGKNIQGDIVAVYNASGTKLISYTYNAWGTTTKTYSGSGASTTAVKNNLTYRGYYYDSDLGLYYLQSRYYDQNTGRFISPDSLMSGVNGSLHGFNLYAYCFNNPISFTDSEGNWPSLSDLYEWYEEGKEKLEEFAEEVKEKVNDAYNNVTEWAGDRIDEAVDWYNEKNEFDPTDAEQSFEGNNFNYDSSGYNLINANDYAVYLKTNYYQDSNRTIAGLYVELQGHYILRPFKIPNVMNGADMGEAVWSVDKTAVISEVIATPFVFIDESVKFIKSKF